MAENGGDVLDRDPSGLLLMCCVQTVYKTEYSKTKTLKILMEDEVLQNRFFNLCLCK